MVTMLLTMIVQFILIGLVIYSMQTTFKNENCLNRGIMGCILAGYMVSFIVANVPLSFLLFAFSSLLWTGFFMYRKRFTNKTVTT